VVKNPVGKIRKCRHREKVQCMPIHLINPTCHARGGVFVHCVRCTRSGGHSPKAGVLEHFELVRGLLHPRKGSCSIEARSGVLSSCSSFGGYSTQRRGLGASELAWGCSTKAGVLEHRSSLGVAPPRRGSWSILSSFQRLHHPGEVAPPRRGS